MMMKIWLIFGILCVLAVFAKTNEPNNSCYLSKMKILLDSATNFIKDAWNVTQELKKFEKEEEYENVTKLKDCSDFLKMGYNKSDVYSIWPQNRIFKDDEIKVFCDMETDGGGWTVIQRRGNFRRSKDYFYKEWSYYKVGFGKITEDFWLGNDNIYALTNQRLYTLRIDMEDLLHEKRHALYDNFWIDGEEYNYTLHVSDYAGNAGDSFGGHNGMKFTTKDKDNDIHVETNCAAAYKGGWWYTSCHSSNLNGLYLNGSHTSYADGVEWRAWKGYNYSLPFVEMKIRPFYFETPKDNFDHNITPR